MRDWNSEDIMHDVWISNLQFVNARLDRAKRRAVLPARPIPDCTGYNTAWREGFIVHPSISHAKRAVVLAQRLLVPSMIQRRIRTYQETVALFG